MSSTPAVGGAPSTNRLRMDTAKPDAATKRNADDGSQAAAPVARTGTADAALNVLGGDPFSTNAGLIVRPEGYGGGHYPINEAAVQRFLGKSEAPETTAMAGGNESVSDPKDASAGATPASETATTAGKEPITDAGVAENAAAIVLQTLGISPESERGRQVTDAIKGMSPEARDAFVNMILSNALKINDDLNKMLLGWIEKLGDSVRASSDKSSEGLND